MNIGVVPGPIVFGVLIDRTCILWETECSGSRNCWMYDNWQLSIYTMLAALGCRVGSLIFYSLALVSYKPSVEDDENAEVGGASEDQVAPRSVKYSSSSEQVEIE